MPGKPIKGDKRWNALPKIVQPEWNDTICLHARPAKNCPECEPVQITNTEMYQ